MKSIIFSILTLAKAGVIIYFAAKVLMNLFRKNDPSSKRRALTQFLSLIGILVGLTILEFGIAYIIPSDS
ncbi:hypothetical protein [Fulvivirga lutimaris]|uniref:hypothetical protein n=1 Tax=Fulvivirga lutimaris TaxID=1819566 RepID=UPI0012BD021A|nr:hypothetical protein [Fulvivirga lutimaris]MTI40489.1 hypothetical protein [Fulvivirga lutimaris]